MADAVTVTESQGVRYSWDSAGFTWSSVSAAKTWGTAYPAAYSVAVEDSVAFADRSLRHWTKRSDEAIPIGESRRHRLTLRESEVLGFSETYSDLIAFLLRFIETMTLTELVSKADRIAIRELFQSADDLSRGFIKRSSEGVSLADSVRRLSIVRITESTSLAEITRRGFTKASAESIGTTERLRRVIGKRMSEALQFAETYADLIAFVLRISEGLGVGDMGAKRLRKPFPETFAAADKMARRAIKRVAEAVAIGEALGRAVAYRRNLAENLSVSDALRKAMSLRAHEALVLAEQYRRRANGVISDMIVGGCEITEDDFARIVETGHPPGYTDFRDFIQGDYTYARALFRAILKSSNSDRGYIEALRVTVDVPDIFDRGTAVITDPFTGVSVGFSRSFRVPPEVTMTHKGGTAVAIPRLLGAVTKTGFNAVLESSSGTRVTGSFTWIAQGY
jgi:hypothetical protein